MKGSLYSDELLGVVVVFGLGLCIECCISYVYVMVIFIYVKLFIIIDVVINIVFILVYKCDICQNVIDLLYVMGVLCLYVVVLVVVEMVNLVMFFMFDVVVFIVMVMCYQIIGVLVDGLLVFDNVISL